MNNHHCAYCFTAPPLAHARKQPQTVLDSWIVMLPSSTARVASCAPLKYTSPRLATTKASQLQSPCCRCVRPTCRMLSHQTPRQNHMHLQHQRLGGIHGDRTKTTHIQPAYTTPHAVLYTHHPTHHRPQFCSALLSAAHERSTLACISLHTALPTPHDIAHR